MDIWIRERSKMVQMQGGNELPTPQMCRYRPPRRAMR